MNKKNILVTVSVVCLVVVCSLVLFRKNDLSKVENISERNDVIEKTEKNVSQTADITNDETKTDVKLPKQDKQSDNLKPSVSKKNVDAEVKQVGLYNVKSTSTIPLSAVAIISSLPENIQDSVLKISETNDIYFMQKNNNKLFIVVNNPGNIRHGIEFAEITISNGQQKRTTLGYNDRIKDSENDIWEYNQETKLPTRHTKYNSDGDMEFVEVWNYDSGNPIKYEMKDSNGKVISIRKETLNDGTDLRVEHLLYDKDGKTRINVSATYDGEDIKRFTYYNADKSDEGGSLFSEYANGYKTKETLYTTDLKVKNTYTSDYKNGDRESIIMWDNHNNEVQRYVTSDKL